MADSMAFQYILKKRDKPLDSYIIFQKRNPFSLFPSVIVYSFTGGQSSR